MKKNYRYGSFARRSMRGVTIALTMAMVVMTGCGSSDAVSEEPKPVVDPVVPVVTPTTLELTRSEKVMVTESNAFAFNLFKVATAMVGPKSMILSPISITYALGMLNNGAAGATQEQINNVLGFGETGADSINAFCYKMLQMAPQQDPQTKVMIANTIYMNKGYELLPTFVEKARAFYAAEPETRDFADGRTMDVINRWASDHTEQMIDKVLDEDTFNPEAVSYLLNAIYFKGTWTKTFDKALTMKEKFDRRGIDGKGVPVEMMHQTSAFDYGETSTCQVLRLPYGNGSYQMTILLPKDGDSALPQVPTAEEWDQLSRKMSSREVDVKLPRFESKTDMGLVPLMMKLGMTDAFNRDLADFRYFCNEPTFISLMKQVAKIKLDEEGTEAAAVTVIGLEKATAVGPEPQPIAFHASHPFLYVISERQTGAVFFIGSYVGE